MRIETIIHSAIAEALKKLYGLDPVKTSIQLQNTRKDFDGDFTLVVFPFIKYSKKNA